MILRKGKAKKTAFFFIITINGLYVESLNSNIQKQDIFSITVKYHTVGKQEYNAHKKIRTVSTRGNDQVTLFTWVIPQQTDTKEIFPT
jgi:hypothetical protein